MKKVGILTFHETLNYGALLQAFALQKYIELSGSEAEIIDYRCEAVYKREFPKTFHDVVGIKEQVKYCLGASKRRKKAAHFHLFASEYMNLSNRHYTSQNISECCKIYDLLITGSDQVWNCELTGEDGTFFLDFTTNYSKKYSYAASFGYGVIPERYVEFTRNKLMGFSKISVREKQGQEIVNKLIGDKADVVLDPTLLLTKEQWFSMLHIQENLDFKEKYILVYLPHDKNNVFRFARKLSRQTGCKIYYVNITYIPMPGVCNLYDLSPRDFLLMIKNAEYVVTGSFHGTAFSVNFERPFYYEETKASLKSGSRIENLVSILGLEGRRISETVDFSEINYINVANKLNNQRMQSQMFLKQIVGE